MSVGGYSGRLVPRLLLHRLNKTPRQKKGTQLGERKPPAIFHWAKDLSRTLRGFTLLMLINPEGEMRLTALSGSETALSGRVRVDDGQNEHKKKLWSEISVIRKRNAKLPQSFAFHPALIFISKTEIKPYNFLGSYVVICTFWQNRSGVLTRESKIWL